VQGTFYIYNLLTKERYNGKPTYETLASSLRAMLIHAAANKVTTIAMPRIGCGLDGLQWSRVKEIMDDIFAESAVQITVFSMPSRHQQ